MSLTTDEIKKLARRIDDAERLARSIKEGFVGKISILGSTAKSNEFRINGDFRAGCGIDGSINQRMFAAQKRGIAALETELKNEAEKIVAEVLGGQ